MADDARPDEAHPWERIGGVANDPLRLTLEQFVIIGGSPLAPPGYAVVASRAESVAGLRSNLRASVVASALRLKSVDYARRNYVDDTSAVEERAAEPLRFAYMDAYMEAKEQITRAIDRLAIDGRPEPTAGEFASSLVLERVVASVWSAHLLFNLGHGFEGYAVARLALEQMAWAKVACSLDSVDPIKKLSANRCITQLKELYPTVGKLYGFLSKATHIGYESHHEFLAAHDGRNAILHAQGDYRSYGLVILTLADLFTVVWELSQHRFIADLESVDIQPEGPRLKSNRPFMDTYRLCNEAIEAASNAVQLDDAAGEASPRR